MSPALLLSQLPQAVGGWVPLAWLELSSGFREVSSFCSNLCTGQGQMDTDRRAAWSPPLTSFLLWASPSPSAVVTPSTSVRGPFPHGYSGGGGLVAQSRPTLATPWTVVCQASLSMGFPRQEYWSGLLFSSLGDLPDPEIEPAFLASPALHADYLPLSYQGSP